MPAAVSSSTVTPSACRDAVGVKPSPAGVSRSSALMAASWPASGVPAIPARTAGTCCPGRRPWSDRNRRTSVTSAISEPISASAAGSELPWPARAPPLACSPGQAAVTTVPPPVSAVHSSSVTNGITGCSSRSSWSSR